MDAHCFFHSRCLRYDFDIWLGIDGCGEAHPDEKMIVHNHQAYGAE